MKKPVLVTGGTGSLGNALIPELLKLKDEYKISRIRVLSRGEQKQVEMADKLRGASVDFLIGDVRDKDRIHRASKDCGAVFHLAALKGVDTAEYNPTECVMTNIGGTRNVMEACQEQGVARAIFISTDKAVSPINIYGVSKAAAEKLWIQGNVGSYSTRFSCVRYGNVLGSNSSVVQRWMAGSSCITDPDMTRFFMRVQDSVELILNCYELMQGGEIFIPKMKATTLKKLFKVVHGGDGEVIGIRPGEKMHEVLISHEERSLVTRTDGMYIRWPSHKLYPFDVWGSEVDVPTDGYTSKNAKQFSEEELRELCQSR